MTENIVIVAIVLTSLVILAIIRKRMGSEISHLMAVVKSREAELVEAENARNDMHTSMSLELANVKEELRQATLANDDLSSQVAKTVREHSRTTNDLDVMSKKVVVLERDLNAHQEKMADIGGIASQTMLP